jgi:hypothetical protein|tara:strand:+ start:320 stop:937 length:618 start_codon:yes stop_codon:yes gene_type:complete
MQIELDLFKRIIHEGRHNPDILDSYSKNQFRAKEKLISHVEKLGIINENSEIVIMAGWYGSIFIPAFKHVKKITLIDLDQKVIDIASNRLFPDYDNVEFIAGDVFEKFRKQYENANLFINTSCEHMKSMKEWGPGPKYKTPWPTRISGSYFAFQSNNMYHIPTHINCVSTIEEFKEQLPDNAEVMIEDKIKDERGIRFLLIGRFK